MGIFDFLTGDGGMVQVEFKEKHTLRNSSGVPISVQCSEGTLSGEMSC